MSIKPSTQSPTAAASEARPVEGTFLDAIRTALRDALVEDDRTFVLGEDVGHFGGAFGVTKGLWEELGDERVLDTPISEEGFVGAALGAAWMGERPIVELQFADFVSCPFDTIVTVAAKTHWRSGIALPVVIRAPFGGGVSGGPFHSQCPEGWFVGVAGLKVVAPGSVADAYGLLRAAIEDDDPVLYFEHKGLYRRLRGELPEPSHRTPLGRAAVARSGRDATIVTYAAGVDLALRAAEDLDVEVLDLRTLWPYDADAVLASLEKTSRLLVLQEAPRSGGVAGHLLSLVAREGFELLDAPPALVSPPDTPVPFAPSLEQAYLPSVESLRAALEELLAY
ncbi:MAG TPA: alpha-ketoacid dehydrogenase subunit beta [Gaiellaceae bacterium]